ncbi:hypothetical protein [Lutibacter sp.]
MKKILGIISVFILLSACQQKTKVTVENLNGIHKVTVKKVIQVSEYTYLLVEENGTSNWLAAPTTNAEVGKVYYYKNPMEMPNFESKELNKTFDKILFIEKLGTTPDMNDIPVLNVPEGVDLAKIATKPVIEKKAVKVTTAKNTISIEELYKNKEKYNGKVVTIKGEVTKFNPAIMRKNWIHLQDGTAYNGDFDLTVTTKIEAKVGDIITLKGTVALNKDFGAGYVYKLIVENAVLAN